MTKNFKRADSCWLVKEKRCQSSLILAGVNVEVKSNTTQTKTRKQVNKRGKRSEMK